MNRIQSLAGAAANTGTTATAAMNIAVTANGNHAVQGVNVINTMQGDKDLIVTIANTTAADISDVVIFPSVMIATPATADLQGTTFTAEGFTNYVQFANYFKVVSTNITSAQISTDDTSNFEGSLIINEKQPTSDTPNPIRKSLKRYRQPVGSGYSETIDVPLNINLWPVMSMKLSKLKKNSEVTFTFNVEGWNKMQTLTPLSASQL